MAAKQRKPEDIYEEEELETWLNTNVCDCLCDDVFKLLTTAQAVYRMLRQSQEYERLAVQQR